MSDNTWSLTNPPPKGHADVGPWAWELFQTAKLERKRLFLEERWKANYRLYRGDHGQAARGRAFTPINLYFANVERTKANITARKPVAQVRDVDGTGDEAEQVLSAKVAAWWSDTKQQSKLKASCLSNEINGVTIEKAVWESGAGRPNTVVVDPFAWFPAPGYWEDISTDLPYQCHAVPEVVEFVERQYEVEPGSVQADDVYTIMGEDREQFRPAIALSRTIPGGVSRVDGGAVLTSGSTTDAGGGRWRERRALVVEVWVKDFTEEDAPGRETIIVDGDAGGPEPPQRKRVYPDGIRVITVTNNGGLVLDDKPNPNLNHELLDTGCMAWGRFPFYKANSYEDPISIWGFSAAEQTADLNERINELFSKIIAYVLRSMSPPLVIPRDTGITPAMVNNKPGLILRPHNVNVASGIRFVPVPSLSPDIFRVLDLLIEFHDRIYQIEDADRGERPTGVIAASAIVALQERNAALIQYKINAMDHLIEMRGRWAISFWQNFGLDVEPIQIKGDEPAMFRGIDYAGRNFSYVVESGSTVPKTTMQTEEQAKEFYKAGVIDRQALLETVNFPGWKEIVERVGEGQLGQALQVLVQAGLPAEVAAELQTFLMQPQGGPGNRPQAPQATGPGVQKIQPGVPRAHQGSIR